MIKNFSNINSLQTVNKNIFILIKSNQSIMNKISNNKNISKVEIDLINNYLDKSNNFIDVTNKLTLFFEQNCIIRNTINAKLQQLSIYVNIENNNYTKALEKQYVYIVNKYNKEMLTNIPYNKARQNIKINSKLLYNRYIYSNMELISNIDKNRKMRNKFIEKYLTMTVFDRITNAITKEFKGLF